MREDMAKHLGAQDVAMAEIKKDVKHGAEAVAKVNHTLDGNGRPGLVHDMTRLKERDTFYSRVCWALITIGTVGSGSALKTAIMPTQATPPEVHAEK